MYLEPHLAAYLFPNTPCGEKDSDNDSGTGEEITSPDEFDPLGDLSARNINKFKKMAQGQGMPNHQQGMPNRKGFEQLKNCGKIDIHGLSVGSGFETKLETTRRQLEVRELNLKIQVIF